MTSVSTFGQAQNQINRSLFIQSQLENAQLQLNTGKKTQNFKGLELDVLRSTRSRAGINAIDSYLNNISTAERRLKIIDVSLNEISSQARTLVGSIDLEGREGDIDMESLRKQATDIYNLMFELLNAKDGERYLMGGVDTASKPVEDSGLLDTAMTRLVADWQAGTISNDDFSAAYRSRTTIPDTTIGYSVALSQNATNDVYIRVDQSVEINATVLANNVAFRDIIVALDAIKNLPDPADAPGAIGIDEPPPEIPSAKQENFYTILNDLTKMIQDGVHAMDSVSHTVGIARARLQDYAENFKEERILLENTVSDIEDADLSEVAVNINFLQIQLEASYRVTASLRESSLVNFL